MKLSCKKNKIKLKLEYEAHENINYKIDGYELQELDKLSPDENKWHKREFESNKKKYMI